MLITIDTQVHGEPREKMPCPFDNVGMTGCHEVEGAWQAA
jgi:hypothetical protein